MLIDVDRLFSQISAALLPLLGLCYTVLSLTLPPGAVPSPLDLFFSFATWPFVITMHIFIAIIMYANMSGGPCFVPGPLLSTYAIGVQEGLYNPIEPCKIPRNLNMVLCWMRDCFSVFGFTAVTVSIGFAIYVDDVSYSVSDVEIVVAAITGLAISLAFRIWFFWFKKRRILRQIEQIRERQQCSELMTPEESETLIQSMLADIL